MLIAIIAGGVLIIASFIYLKGRIEKMNQVLQELQNKASQISSGLTTLQSNIEGLKANAITVNDINSALDPIVQQVNDLNILAGGGTKPAEVSQPQGKK